MSDIFFILLLNIFMYPLFSLVDIPYFKKLLRRWYISKVSSKGVIQQEAHQIFEGPSFNLTELITYLIRVLWAVMFFLPLYPLFAPAAAFACFSLYWILKYLMIHRFAKPETVNSEIIFNCLPLFGMSKFILPVSLDNRS
jgi:hypothetical protein